MSRIVVDSFPALWVHKGVAEADIRREVERAVWATTTEDEARTEIMRSFTPRPTGVHVEKCKPGFFRVGLVLFDGAPIIWDTYRHSEPMTEEEYGYLQQHGLERF